MRLLLGWGRIDRGSGFDKRAIDVIKGVSGLQNGHSLRRATARRKSPKANRPARCAGKCRKWSLPAKAPRRSSELTQSAHYLRESRKSGRGVPVSPPSRKC